MKVWLVDWNAAWLVGRNEAKHVNTFAFGS